MAAIEWKPVTWQLYNDYLEDARIAYGEKTAQRWENEIVHIYDRLKKHPISYTQEELLRGRKPIYRRCLIMSRRFKIIYYYDESEDVVHIVDIWDTRMNPKALIKRIK